MSRKQRTPARSELQSFPRKITAEWIRKHPREWRALSLRSLKWLINSTRRTSRLLERQYSREVAGLRAFEWRKAA